MRGGFIRTSQWTPSATTVPFGVIPATALGINNAATIGVAPWDATLAGTATSLMTPSTTLTFYSPNGSQYGSALTVTTTTAPGPRWINFLGSLYGLGYGAASTLSDKGSTYKINASAVLNAPLTGNSAISSSTQSIMYNSATDTQDSSGTISWMFSSGTWEAPTTFTTWPAGAYTNILTVPITGFSIPAGNNIIGIEVAVTSVGRPNTAPADVLVSVTGGSGTPTNRARFTQKTNTQTVTYGGPTSLWGQTWTPAEINSGATLKYQLKNTTGSSQPYSSFLFELKNPLSVTVYYEPSSPFTAPTALTGAPTGSVDITQYQSRIWLAAGCDVPGGGTYHEPTTIFWTNPVTSTNPLTNTTADWRYTDPVSGVTSTNKVVIDNNGADPVMGFGRVTGAMIIFRRSSVYVLKGTTTANYQITKVSGNVGCLDPRSIVESDEGVYFMSLEGLMLTNGSKISLVSTSVSQALQDALAYEQSVVLAGNANAQSGWISCGITSQGHITVSVGVVGASVCASLPLPQDTGIALQPTAMRTIWSGVYDPDTGSWYRLTSYLFGIDSGLWNPATFIGVPDVPQLFVSNRLVGQRSLHVLGNAGITALEDQALNMSYLNGGSLYDTVNAGEAGNVSPEVGAITGLLIPARWHSKMAPIVGTTTLDRRYGMPKRFFLDHALSVSPTSLPLNYSSVATVSSNVAALTSLTGVGTAWSTGLASACPVTTTVASSTTEVAWIASLPGSGSSNELTMIPPMQTVPGVGAVITGVQVVLYKNGNPETTYTDTVQLYYNGAPIGTAKTGVTWPSTPGFSAYGNSSDTWGAFITSSMVNSGSFGVGITVTNDSATAGEAVVYLANIIVYWAPSSPPLGYVLPSAAAPSWTVTPYDSDGSAYPNSLACSVSSSVAPADPRSGPSVVAPVTGNTILRENLDFSSEVSNLTYDTLLPAITSYTSVLSGSVVIGPGVMQFSAANVIGEIYGIGTEYQTAHDLRTKTT